MNIEELRNYCLSKKGVEECFPFDESTLVFKVDGKMFVLTGLHEKPISVNLKYDKDLIEDLREKFECVTPGYHMNKQHWNTIVFDGSVPDEQLCKWIDRSYELVISKNRKNINN